MPLQPHTPASPGHITLGAFARPLVMIASLTCLAPALAQRPWPDAASATSWGVGLGVSSGQRAYAGMDRETRVIPLLQFENAHVRLLGPALEVKLPGLAIDEAQRLEFSLVARYALSEGYEPDDSPVLAGMSERKADVRAGAKVTWKNPWAHVATEWVHDVSGHSRGQKLGLSLDRTWRLGPVVLTPRAVAHWQDNRLNNHLYGVQASEVAGPSRPAHVAGGGLNVEAGLRAIYQLDSHHSVMLDASVTRLASTIRHSPLVDRITENRVFSAYLYRF